MRKHFKIEVTGRGRFPVDMLRYGSLYPVDPDTAKNIEYSFERESWNETRTYHLAADFTSYVAVDHALQRFASFGFYGEITDEYKVA